MSVDITRLIQSMYAQGTIGPLDLCTTTSFDAIKAAFQSQTGAKNITLFAGCAEGIAFAVDRRTMTRKEASLSSLTSFGAIAHLESNWTRGRLVHVFYQSRPVFVFVVPVSSDTASEGGQSTLNTIVMPALTDVVDFEEDAYETTTQAATSTDEDTGRKRTKK